MGGVRKGGGQPVVRVQLPEPVAGSAGEPAGGGEERPVGTQRGVNGRRVITVRRGGGRDGVDGHRHRRTGAGVDDGVVGSPVGVDGTPAAIPVDRPVEPGVQLVAGVPR